MNMDLTKMYFVVDSIDGDYAHLRRTDEEGEKLVARALLPSYLIWFTEKKLKEENPEAGV